MHLIKISHFHQQPKYKSMIKPLWLAPLGRMFSSIKITKCSTDYADFVL